MRGSNRERPIQWLGLEWGREAFGEKLLVDRLASTEAGIGLVPVLNPGLAQPPAKLDGPALVSAEEVHQSTAPILELAADGGKLVSKLAQNIQLSGVPSSKRFAVFFRSTWAWNLILFFQETDLFVLSNDVANDPGYQRQGGVGVFEREDFQATLRARRLLGLGDFGELHADLAFFNGRLNMSAPCHKAEPSIYHHFTHVSTNGARFCFRCPISIDPEQHTICDTACVENSQPSVRHDLAKL